MSLCAFFISPSVAKRPSGRHIRYKEKTYIITENALLRARYTKARAAG
nr:MAG TPA: hypothetical protein [Caudoviricetes sp.]